MKRKPNHVKNSTSFGAAEIAAFNFGHLYCTIENQLEQFAVQEGCPYSISYIADRISGLLYNKAIRESLRDTESLQAVRAHSTEARTTKPSQDVYVDAPRKRTLSKAALKAISRAQRARWAKWHASQKHTKTRKPYVMTPARRKMVLANLKKARAAQAAKRKAA